MTCKVLLALSFLGSLTLAGCGSGSSVKTPAAQPPTANAGGPYAGTVGTAVTFTSSGSSDPQAQALTYSWNFGDNTTGSGASPTHPYTTPGAFTVSLTVTDTSNLSGSSTTKATIAALPPIVKAGGPYTGTVGTAITFSGSASTDPQGETLSYAWNFGDNTTGTGVSPTHTYLAGGLYSVTLTVTNTSNLSASATAQATIPTGSVHEGQQAVSGASVYLFAAGTSGYGNASVSLLNAASTGSSNSLGAYVTTDAKGNFVWSGLYSCTPGTQVYAYALGGNVGAVPNAAAGFVAVLGNCPSAGNFNTVPSVQINEASTVAAAYAFAGFAVDATHVSSSGTALAQVGIANAFANAANLVSLSTGQSLATTPTGNGTVPQTTLNTLADILAACAGSSGATSSACTTLFSSALASGAAGAQPTDTATAAINIAHNPGLNVAALFALVVTAPPFTPALTAAPADFTIALSFTGGGLSEPEAIAVDGSGNVLVANENASSISEFSSTGSPLSGSTGYTGGGLLHPTTIAVDSAGNSWTLNLSTDTLIEFSSSGAVLSGTSGFPGGGIQPGPFSGELAIDGSGDIWGASNTGAVEWSNSGSVLSGTSGYGTSSIQGGSDIGIDASGNAWVLNAPSSEITKYSSTGAILSPANGYKGGGLDFPMDVAFDNAGNAFIINFTNCTCTGNGAITVVKLSSSGASLAGPNGLIWGGLVGPGGIAIDGAGNAWITNFGLSKSNYAGSGLLEFTNSLAIVSPTYGYTASGVIHAPAPLAIDGSGNLWTVSGTVSNTLTEVVGAAVPVVTPLATGVKNNTLGARP